MPEGWPIANSLASAPIGGSFPSQAGLAHSGDRRQHPAQPTIQRTHASASAMPAKTVKPSQWFCLKAVKQPSRVRPRISV